MAGELTSYWLARGVGLVQGGGGGAANALTTKSLSALTTKSGSILTKKAA